jgi:hypothetical protein
LNSFKSTVSSPSLYKVRPLESEPEMSPNDLVKLAKMSAKSLWKRKGTSALVNDSHFTQTMNSRPEWLNEKEVNGVDVETIELTYIIKQILLKNRTATESKNLVNFLDKKAYTATHYIFSKAEIGLYEMFFENKKLD